MTRFITTADGLINLDHVAVIRQRIDHRDDLNRIITDIELNDGTITTSTNAGDLDHLAEQLVPATPGYYAVKLWNPGTADEFIEQAPVVAWRIVDNAVEAAVAIGYEPGERAGDVLTPDGRVILICDCEHATLDEWLTAEREHAALRAALADETP